MKFLLVLVGLAEAKRLSLKWVVGQQWMAPDNYAIPGIAINRQFPGPTVTLDVGDTVRIKITNRLDHPLTIHWHGLLQKGSPEADGVPYVTQDPIPCNTSYTYQFTARGQTGTYWYHAHTRLDAELLYGALIIKEPKATLEKAIRLDRRFHYDEERVLILSSLWHKPIDQLYQGLVGTPSVNVGPPQSILTNGATYDEWPQQPNTSLPFTRGYAVVNVRPNKRYRLRIIAAQGHAYYALHIPGHRFTVIEADGTLVVPFESDHVHLNSGMRYSAIIETCATPQNVYIHTSILGDENATNNGVAILHYAGAPAPLRKKLHIPTKKNLFISSWFEDQLKTLFTDAYRVPRTYRQSLVVNFQFKGDGGSFRFLVNNVTHQERNVTLLPGVLARTSHAEPGVYPIRSDGQGVQVVLQSYALDNRPCDIHPWHLHGHSFYVLARGSGVYTPKLHDPTIHSMHPILRDTFTFFPHDAPRNMDNTVRPAPPTDPKLAKMQSCGWAAIRFRADNPGAWLMHCHYTAHMIEGMQLIVNELPSPAY